MSSIAPQSSADDSRSTSPGQRPSYFDYSSTAGLYPPQHTFDERVIKKLDPELSNCSGENDNGGEGDTTEEEEQLKTFLRIRPTGNGACESESVLELKDANTIVAYTNQRGNFPERVRKQTEFKFSKILGAECGQSAVFEECVTPIIEKFLKNENCLVFSYGATNSGKTYTMQGHGTEYGIIPRTLDAIFSRIHDRQYKVGNIRPHLYQGFLHLTASAVDGLMIKRDQIISEANIKQELMDSYRLSTSGFSDKSGSTVDLVGAGHMYDPNTIYTNATLYSVWVSYAELYNERVYDLLDNSPYNKAKRRKELKLLQDRNGFVYIKDLTELPVTSDEEAYKLFLAGRKNLQFAATQMNQHSSRSHSFFTIRVVSLGIGDGLIPYPKTVHRMTFCDLAGMERANQTENEGCRLKESGNINNSLIVLLKVIRILREKQSNHGNGMIETIPFRESKLTHIFKSYLTSSTHICMVVNVSPDPSVADSTLQVLQNSAIASNVIVFRPLDLNNQAQDGQNSSQGRPLSSKSNMPPAKYRKLDSDSVTTDQFTEDSESEAEDYGIPTVIAPKTMLQRLQHLERENVELRRLLASERAESEAEKIRIRDNFLRLMSEDRAHWREHTQKVKLKEENFNQRRLSLMKHQLSPGIGARCGKCSPPIQDMEDIDETFEEREESADEEETGCESDKEN